MAEQSQNWHPAHNPWAIALTVTIATFMEVMDTSIANVALPHIAGGLSAGQDESTWVLTSYLVSNAVVLPCSAWLSERFGRKRFYMTCVALFTLSSFLCGLAPSLGMLIFFRVLQGIGGGGLAPSEQAILADTFPAAKRGMAFSGLRHGGRASLPPSGPTSFGGWITDHYSWRWIFYVNVPFGVFSLFMTQMMVEDPPQMKQAKIEAARNPIDFVGLTLIGLGLGAFQIVLDKGQRENWFDSGFITTCSVVAAFALVAFIVWEWRNKHPVVHIRLFKNPSFRTAAILMLTLGAVLFGTTVLIPQFVQVELGWSAQQAGEVLSPGGIAILFMMPIVGFLVSRVDARYLIGLGFVTLTFSMVHMTDLNLGIDYRTAMMWRVYQSLGLAFLFVPINTISFNDIPPNATNQVSALMNLMRNMGGSIGISAVTTLLVRRTQSHHAYLVKNTIPSDPQFQSTLQSITRGLTPKLGPTEAMRQAYARIEGLVHRQASALAYIDIFWIMATVCALAIGLLFFVKKNKPGQSAPAH